MRLSDVFRCSLFLLAVIGSGLAAGCSAPPVRLAERRHYPQKTPVAAPLEILVERQRHTFTLDNRSGRSFSKVQLWLNHEYGAELESIEPGLNGPIPFNRFFNEHGEAYPTGSFFQPERNRKLVLVDLYDGQAIHKLTVRLEPNWHLP